MILSSPTCKNILITSHIIWLRSSIAVAAKVCGQDLPPFDNQLTWWGAGRWVTLYPK